MDTLQTPSQVNALLQPRIPCATYRVQFSRDFTFHDAELLVPYLHDLGISDLYASPILRAVPGSTHGYDICDPTMLNPELGTMDDFLGLSAALRERGMGLLVDIVPNHMGIAGDCNAWWIDVLENGPSSQYADFFDISWSPVKPELENKVLLPVLEDQYGNVLDSGKLQVEYDSGAFSVRYGDQRFPLTPRSYDRVLRAALEQMDTTSGVSDAPTEECESILTAIGYLPRRDENDSERRAERHREKEVIKRRIAAVIDASYELRAALDAALVTLNGTPGDPRSFDALDELLSMQAYRLAFWRVAGEEINYRRFFDINTMAAIHSENPDVFDATHGFLFELMRDGHITGLRVDHPDGLWNPVTYFRRLQGSVLSSSDGERRLYVVAEKILSENEPLPQDWAVYGTTGYDFLNLANGLFINLDNEQALTEIYSSFAPAIPPFRDLEYASKKKIMRDSLAGEINALAHRLERLSESNRHTRDFTLNGLRHAIEEVIACFTIYRTYVNGTDEISARDQRFVEAAVREAQQRNPQMPRSIFIFLRDTLLLRNVHEFSESVKLEMLDFVMRFQQISSPIMAKSIEDTAFYVYNRFVSVNEVGGSPAQFGTSLDQFHTQTTKRSAEWPHAMLTLSTHDTKRSEDVRARLNVLSEMPDEWRTAVAQWHELNDDKKSTVDDAPAPDANDEYLLYQTLVGAWSADSDAIETDDAWSEFCQRISAYMAKATHEAKVHTSWTNPDESYDAAVSAFVASVLDRRKSRAFLDSLGTFTRCTAFYGRFNSLAQTLLKLTCPGVPDTYRGTETWDYSLVDPDNRRPVDYAHLRTLLADLSARCAMPDFDRAALASELVNTAADGRLKVYLLQRALAFRRDHERLFNEGDYVPLKAQGAKAAHVCAFARTEGSERLITIVPRLIVGLTDSIETPLLGEGIWKDTCLMLPDDMRGVAWTNVFTGERLSVEDGMLMLADVFRVFPAALLSYV